MKKQNKKGFTLTELVIVIVIIAILAAVLIPSMTGYVNRAKKSNATSEASSVYTIYAAWLADTAANYGYDSVIKSDLKIDNSEVGYYINGLRINSSNAIETAKITNNSSDTSKECATSTSAVQYYYSLWCSAATYSSSATTSATETSTCSHAIDPAVSESTYHTVGTFVAQPDSTEVQTSTTTTLDTDGTKGVKSVTYGNLLDLSRAYLDSFAYYYAEANDTTAYDGKNVDNNGLALVNVNKITFIDVTKTSFTMYSSNNFLVTCDISSGAPVYTIADAASVPTMRGTGDNAAKYTHNIFKQE